MPNVSVAVLNYFEDDLGRFVCDRSLQKVNPMHGPVFSQQAHVTPSEFADRS